MMLVMHTMETHKLYLLAYSLAVLSWSAARERRGHGATVPARAAPPLQLLLGASCQACDSAPSIAA
jgi:hypothetical protein